MRTSRGEQLPSIAVLSLRRAALCTNADRLLKQHARVAVFSHCASTCPALPLQIPKVYTHYAATALFFFFGFKTLWDAYHHADVSAPAACVAG